MKLILPVETLVYTIFFSVIFNPEKIQRMFERNLALNNNQIFKIL